MNDILVLIGLTYAKNDLLEQVPVGESRTEVFGEARSVTRAEWYEGGREGMKPSVVFVVPSMDYAGQQEAEFCGRRYRIYRTYRPREREEIELYLEEKSGVCNG